MLEKYAVDGAGSQLVAGALAGRFGAIQMVTDPSAFFTSLPDVNCCDPSCETGWIGPHFRSTAPPGLLRLTAGPGVPLS